MWFYIKSFIVMTLLLTSFTGCNKGHDENEYKPLYSKTPIFTQKSIYIFGVHPLHNPKRLFEVYQPMVDYINEKLEIERYKICSNLCLFP